MKLNSRASHLFTFGLLALGLFVQPAPARQDNSKLAIPATDDGLPGAGPIRRYDWFRKLWVERRSAWAAHARQDHGAFVFLGDSITQGWGDTMGNAFPGLKVANRGISGDTTRGVLIRLDQDVLALDPEGVVILIGTNDLEEGADPETIAANLKLIIAKLEAHSPKMPILLCQVFPSTAKNKRPADQIKKINRLYAAAIKGDAQVIPIDTWPLFADKQGDAKVEEFPDLLHPNGVGYAKWAGALHTIFATLGLMDTAPDTWAPEEGFTSLFNGHDLTGWGYLPSLKGEIEFAAKWHKDDKNAPPWPIVASPISFSGKATSDDGRYAAINGRLVVKTPAEYRKIQKLSTMRAFPTDFVLKLEFRASAYADSGIFIREPQLQCRDYIIAGPYEKLTKYKAQEWNQIEVTVKGTEAYCTCNGEVLEAAFKLPATGPIGLEGDRGQMEYRHIQLKEIP